MSMRKSFREESPECHSKPTYTYITRRHIPYSHWIWNGKNRCETIIINIIASLESDDWWTEMMYIYMRTKIEPSYLRQHRVASRRVHIVHWEPIHRFHCSFATMEKLCALTATHNSPEKLCLFWNHSNSMRFTWHQIVRTQSNANCIFMLRIPFPSPTQ